jgi:hypothetical protein
MTHLLKHQIYDSTENLKLEHKVMAKVNPIQLQKHLKGMDYPASKENLIQHAKKNGADQDVCSVLEQLPDEEYETPADVSKAVGNVE